jgi:hypothetical protein
MDKRLLMASCCANLWPLLFRSVAQNVYGVNCPGDHHVLYVLRLLPVAEVRVVTVVLNMNRILYFHDRDICAFAVRLGIIRRRVQIIFLLHERFGKLGWFRRICACHVCEHLIRLRGLVILLLVTPSVLAAGLRCRCLSLSAALNDPDAIFLMCITSDLRSLIPFMVRSTRMCPTSHQCLVL